MYFIFKFCVLVIGKLYLCVSKNVRICGYFSKLKGVREQKCLGNNSVGIFGNKSLNVRYIFVCICSCAGPSGRAF